MTVRDLTARIDSGMRVVVPMPRATNSSVESTVVEKEQNQDDGSYQRVSTAAKRVDEAVEEYNKDTEEIQRLAERYAESEGAENSGLRQKLSELIREKLRALNVKAEAANTAGENYNEQYTAAAEVGTVGAGAKYESISHVADQFVAEGGGVYVETGGLAPEVAYLRPAQSEAQSRQQVKEMTKPQAPDPVRAEDPLTGALLSAGVGAGVGAAAKVAGKVTVKIGAAAGKGNKAAKVVVPVIKPVAGKTITKIEKAVAAKVSPGVGAATGGIARSLTTPAMLPLNAATFAYGADVIGRVTEEDAFGNAPDLGTMGGRAAAIAATEVLPFAGGAIVGGMAAERVMSGASDKLLERKFVRAPHGTMDFKASETVRGYGLGKWKRQESAGRNNPFSVDTLKRMTYRDGEWTIKPAGTAASKMNFTEARNLLANMEGQEIRRARDLADAGYSKTEIRRIIQDERAAGKTITNNPLSKETIQRMQYRDGEWTIKPAGTAASKMNFTEARNLLAKMQNTEIKRARDLSEAGYSKLDIRRIIETERNSKGANQMKIEPVIKMVYNPATLPSSPIATKQNRGNVIKRNKSTGGLLMADPKQIYTIVPPRFVPESQYRTLWDTRKMIPIPSRFHQADIPLPLKSSMKADISSNIALQRKMSPQLPKMIFDASPATAALQRPPTDRILSNILANKIVVSPIDRVAYVPRVVPVQRVISTPVLSVSTAEILSVMPRQRQKQLEIYDTASRKPPVPSWPAIPNGPNPFRFGKSGKNSLFTEKLRL